MRGTSKAVEKWRRLFTSALYTHVLERRSLEKGPKLLMHSNLLVYSANLLEIGTIVINNLQPILRSGALLNRMQASPTSEKAVKLEARPRSFDNTCIVLHILFVGEEVIWNIFRIEKGTFFFIFFFRRINFNIQLTLAIIILIFYKVKLYVISK